MDPARASTRPIVILGLCKRTGTNFLAQLLRRHEAVAAAPPIWEHFLLNEADVLGQYVRRTRRHWDESWGDLDEAEQDLLAHLGDGSLQFLLDRVPGKRLVAKSPSVENLSMAPTLFRRADVIVLVRDGRSTAASLGAGFDWSMERAMQTWHRGAAEARAFFESLGLHEVDPAHKVTVAESPGGLRAALVRYEDFVDPASNAIDELLAFCSLDPDRYDRDAAASMPVYGSSFEAGSGGVNWAGAERTADFDPTTRFADWSSSTHDRFDHLAGEANQWFGYGRSGTAGTSGTTHRVADTLWPARRTVIRATGVLRNRLGRG